MKKIGRVLGIVVLILSLVACGNGREESNWTESSTASTVAAPKQTTTTEATVKLTEEEAARKVLAYTGDRDDETGFEFTAGCEEETVMHEGREYYAVRLSWLVQDDQGILTHSSYLAHYFVSVDGMEMYEGYRQGQDLVFDKKVNPK